MLKAGGHLISISGPPDIGFARSLGMNPVLRFVVGMLSRGIVKKAKRLGVDYSFLFVRADGRQLAEIAKLIDAEPSARWSTRSFRLRRRRTPSLMSKPGGPRARWSSRVCDEAHRPRS